MALRSRRRAVRLLLPVLPSVITLTALSATAAVALELQSSGIRSAAAERVQTVASSLADLREVRVTLEEASGEGTPTQLADATDLAEETARLQPIAELVAEAAGVYYVVVTDDEGVRITHPLASERGVQVSTTNASVLAGTPFLGTETGPSGRSLRAKVPVRSDEGEVIGMVAVGVLESDIEAQSSAALRDLLPWVVGALIIGTVASSLLTAAVERRFRRLDGMAVEHEQMRRTTAALREQSHEFHTRLHVVHGLISHGDPREALDYIENVVAVEEAAAEDASRRGSAALRDAAVHAVRAELLDMGAQAEFDLDPDVAFDDAVVSVVANLCRNAGEAGATRVRCTLHAGEGRVSGWVEDDGPGIDPRVAPRIFARGFSTKADAAGWGRGIGLDLVRRTVTSRDGTIEVGTSPLGGSRFSFDMADA